VTRVTFWETIIANRFVAIRLIISESTHTKYKIWGWISSHFARIKEIWHFEHPSALYQKFAAICRKWQLFVGFSTYFKTHAAAGYAINDLLCVRQHLERRPTRDTGVNCLARMSRKGFYLVRAGRLAECISPCCNLLQTDPSLRSSHWHLCIRPSPSRTRLLCRIAPCG